MNRTKTTPKALREVWEWKEACHRRVARLPPREAIDRLLEDADRTAKSLGLTLKTLETARSDMVAEKLPTYASKNRPS